MPYNSFADYPMSWKPVLDRNSRPLYLALARQLADDVMNGILLPGTKLPPQRELADFLDINVSTVSRAFRLCSDKGMLTSVTGSGTFVAYDVRTSLSVVPDQASPMIEMGSMMPETLADDEITCLLRQMMDEPGRFDFFQYSMGGENWHRDAALALLREAGIEAARGDILLASGGQNAIAAVLAGLFRPGDRIGVDPLVYPGLKSAAKLLGIRLVPVGQERGEMSEEGLWYAIRNHHIKGIYITPDFQNPTTHIMSTDGRRMLARVAKKTQILVIEDAITSLLLSRPLPPVRRFLPEQTVYILSLSKTILPALRLAYLVVPELIRDSLAETLYAMNLSQSEILLELASRLIVSHRVQDLMSLRRRRITMRNSAVNAILQGYTVRGDDCSLCRWLELPEPLTGSRFENLARQKGVHVLWAEHFTVGTQPPEHGVRLSVGSPRDREELQTALWRLREILDNQRNL